MVQEISEGSTSDCREQEKQENSMKVTEVDKENPSDRQLGREATFESLRGASGHGQSTLLGDVSREERGSRSHSHGNAPQSAR